MWYIIIILISAFIINYFWKNVFNWEAIIKYLWKELYKKADMMATLMKSNDSFTSSMYDKPIKIIGNLINSILDFINFFDFNEEKEEGQKEQTYGYGRFDYEHIKDIAKNNPEFFRKFNKK